MFVIKDNHDNFLCLDYFSMREYFSDISSIKYLISFPSEDAALAVMNSIADVPAGNYKFAKMPVGDLTFSIRKLVDLEYE